jgi:hypothetical protein
MLALLFLVLALGCGDGGGLDVQTPETFAPPPTKDQEFSPEPAGVPPLPKKKG